MNELIQSALLQIYCYGMVWLVWRFKMRDATRPWPCGLTVFVWFHSLALLVAAGTAAAGFRSWAQMARLPEVRTLAGMASTANQERVLLAGRAAADYSVTWEPDASPVWASSELELALEDGRSRLRGADRARRVEWNASISSVVDSREWITAREPVTVVATIEHATGLLGETKGKLVASGVAEVVFRGTPRAFRSLAEAHAQRLLPRLGAWVALCAAVVTAALPLVLLLRQRGGSVDPGASAPPHAAPDAASRAGTRAGGLRRKELAWLNWLDRTDRRTAFVVATATAATVLLLALSMAGPLSPP